MNVMTHKGYAARVEFDADDRIFVGHLAGISSEKISEKGSSRKRECRCTPYAPCRFRFQRGGAA